MSTPPLRYSTQATNEQFIATLLERYPEQARRTTLLVNISQQRLYHLHHQQVVQHYPISSAANGTGNEDGSGKTPLGAHFIREKVGCDAPLGSQFSARKLTDYVPNILTHPDARSDGDYITSRILWLSGLETGTNQGEGIDSYLRYIYIHGTDEEGRLGTLASHGCIRMANQAIIDLYDLVELSALVYIYEH